jgi:glycerate 2-kinase
MKFLVAPNAFKGTVSAEEAAGIISGKLGELSGSSCIIQPVADGGDGTCSLLIDSLTLEKIPFLTLNAVGQPISGYFGWDILRKKAYLDISTASGIGSLEPWQRDPSITSTYGTGRLILKAIQMGAEEIILGLGGSATVDMGLGILNALGILFLDKDGREIPAFAPNFLKKIKHIQKTTSIPKVKFTCLCDVKNQFFGENGAVAVFGPQKGLILNQIRYFEDTCLEVLGLLIKKSGNVQTDRQGFGAAGGVAMGLSFFFPTEIKFGADYFFELVGMNAKVKQSDWIITGEGHYDSQSDQGKACYALLQLSKSLGKKTALITAGSGGRNAGFDLVMELPSLDFSMENFKEIARKNLGELIRITVLEGKLD